MISALAMSASLIPFAQAEIPQKEQLEAMMEPHGENGKIVYESMVEYAKRCGNEGYELAVLLYFGSSENGEANLARLVNAKSQSERDAIVKSLECPE